MDDTRSLSKNSAGHDTAMNRATENRTCVAL
jgi:hypothetical protein